MSCSVALGTMKLHEKLESSHKLALLNFCWNSIAPFSLMHACSDYILLTNRFETDNLIRIVPIDTTKYSHVWFCNFKLSSTVVWGHLDYVIIFFVNYYQIILFSFNFSFLFILRWRKRWVRKVMLFP